jgi:hypothetical protein
MALKPGQFFFYTVSKTWMELANVKAKTVEFLLYSSRDPRKARPLVWPVSRVQRLLNCGQLLPECA